MKRVTKNSVNGAKIMGGKLAGSNIFATLTHSLTHSLTHYSLLNTEKYGAATPTGGGATIY